MSVPTPGQHRAMYPMCAIQRTDDKCADKGNTRHPFGNPIGMSECPGTSGDSQTTGFFPENKQVAMHHCQAGHDNRGKIQAAKSGEKLVER